MNKVIDLNNAKFSDDGILVKIAVDTNVLLFCFLWAD